MMEFLKVNVLKKYFWFVIIIAISFWIFVILEKNSHSYLFKLNNENELNTQSIMVLNKLTKDNAVVFTAFTKQTSAVAKKIKQFFEPYKKNNKNISLEFLDPLTHPNEMRANAVTIQGEIVLTYNNDNTEKKVNITELSESSIINGVLRLLNQKDEWLVIAEGYGMPTITDETNQGLSLLLIHLKKLGYQVARMPLNTANIVPENVKAIILPAPTKELDAEMVEWLNMQILQGTSLWWLNDVGTGSQTHLELILDVLNSNQIMLNKQNDSDYVSEYPDHLITENFNQPIYIAQAREIIADGYSALFKNNSDLTFGVTQQINNSRIIITGDSDLIRNQYLNVAANKSIIIRIIDWLLHHDDRVNVPVKINTNTQLLLTQNQLLGLSLSFLILLPLFYMVIAIVQWKKKHAR